MKDATVSGLRSKPTAYGIFCFLGMLFCFCCLTERDLARQGNILWSWGYLGRTLGISLLLGGGMGAALCFVIYRRYAGKALGQGGRLEKSASPEENTSAGHVRFGRWLWSAARGGNGRGKIFGLSLGLVFAAWIPVFLAYYPAICAYDAFSQTGQVVEHYYIDHHPIFHTLLIKFAMWLGERVLGSINGGIGCYTLSQMLLLAAAFAFCVMTLWQRRVRRIWLILVQIFCMFYPFHLYMSVSMTKDTVFAAFFLVQLTSLSVIMDGGKHRGMKMVFYLATVGMILFRNNGKYAFLVFLAVLFLVFVLGKQRRLTGRVLLWSVGAFVTGTVLLQGVFYITNASQGDRREMLSLPIQQFARTMLYHGGVGVMAEDDNTMEERDKALINDFILDEAYRKYRPEFADPVKSRTNTYVARYRAGEFISSYLRLFRQYPGDFLNAGLALNAGYLYPGDVSHAYVNAQEGDRAGGGYVQTRWDEETLNSRGIYKDTKWRGLFEAMEAWADENAYLKLPVLKYLFVPGVVFWLYLLLLGCRFVRRELTLCMPIVLVLGYFLTLFLGPTVQLRYLYPVMIGFPFLALWSGTRGGEISAGGVECGNTDR